MKIGEALIKAGLISEQDLSSALDEQQKTHERLGSIALNRGLVTPDSIAPVLAQYFELPFINLRDKYKEIKPEVIDAVPVDLARRFNLLPIDLKDKVLTIAIFDPLDILAVDTLRIKTGYKIQCVIAAETAIQEAVEYCYQNLSHMQENIEQFIHLTVQDSREEEEETEASQYGATDQPVVQYVKSLIVQAISNDASDIILQPKQHKAELRFRIDGVLYNMAPPPKAMIPAITTRVKIISGLDIAEKRLPQDGRFKVKLGRSDIDIRISTFPTIYGESVVMRLLDTSKPLLGLEHLGLQAQDLEKYRELIRHSYGLILVTGPTGSGKTTTLYASLNEIKSAEKNIVTLEDPVEYRLPFIQQSQVNSNIGFTFARGLRSLMRQDPDIIMVGEIRDKETAEIAIHASLTGHLVFATLHTNDASGAAVRLVNMGIEPFLITSSLIGIVAQRLIRMNCAECSKIYDIAEGLRKRLALDGDIDKISRGEGCPKCLQSGYKGRKGIYEVLVPNDSIRRLILEKRSSEEVRSEAQKAGMKTLRQIGVEELSCGMTSPEELFRVTQETEEF